MSFNEEYKLFKEKSEGFLTNMGFRDQYDAHKAFLDEMHQEVKENDSLSPELLELRDESIKAMESIVSMQAEILALFDMPKEIFEKKYKKSVKKADKFISDRLKNIEETTLYFESINQKAAMINSGTPQSFSV